MKQVPPDVLAERYATEQSVAIWSPENKTRLLRSLWILDLKIRAMLGKAVDPAAIAAYEKVKDDIRLDSIAVREFRLKHDVMANIEEFNELAGYQLTHRGFTSRDETDNTEQLQILQSSCLIRDRNVAVLRRLKEKIERYALLDICGRSHLVPAQTVTLGKRFGNIAQELLVAFEDFEHFIEVYPLRGIKGPMGTQQDMIAQLGGPELALRYENEVRKELGFKEVLVCVGQVYPRMLDFKALSHLASLASAMGNFAKMVRLMAGLELAHEGFKDEQAGSSAMPHKVNSRTCERITALLNVLNGFLDMTSRLLGDQWFEGDVSCSVVRRVALPGAFYAMDGLLEAALHILDEMEIFPKVIEAELKRFLPFLSTTAILTMATKKGMGRQDAHAVIKKAAVGAVKVMREGGPNLFLALLAEHDQFPFEETKPLIECVDHGASFEQGLEICSRINAIMERYPEAALYDPAPLR